MICPRCGTSNGSDRPTCTRCAGSLAPPPVQSGSPLPAFAITRRAELAMGASRGTSSPAAEAGSRSATTAAPPAPAAADLYLLASDRATGQPAPPEGPLGQNGPVRTERPGRVAVGLTGKSAPAPGRA